MTTEEIFTKIAQHMEEGVVYHKMFMQAYNFLGLHGFAKCHAYHWFEEECGYECLLQYYFKHYHKLINITPPTKPPIIPETWYKYSTQAVDTNTKRQSVQDLMNKWLNWEKETKKLYSDMYKELENAGEIADAAKIKYYIQAVDEELIHIEKKIIKLESIDYNINTIISWQQPMYKKYKKKMR